MSKEKGYLSFGFRFGKYNGKNNVFTNYIVGADILGKCLCKLFTAWRSYLKKLHVTEKLSHTVKQIISHSAYCDFLKLNSFPH